MAEKTQRVSLEKEERGRRRLEREGKMGKRKGEREGGGKERGRGSVEE